MTLAQSHLPGTKPLPGLRMSYEEFLETDFDHHHYEWVDGEAIEMGQIEDEHGDIQVYLIRLLGDFVEAKQLGRIKAEPTQMKTGPDLPGRSPDLMFIANENVSRIERLCVRGPADLVIEIVSQSSRRIDRVTKYREYERGGVKEYWLIDPLRRTVAFFSLDNGRYVPIAADDDDRLQSVVLPGVWFRDAWFFERPAKAAVLKDWGLAAG